MPGFAIARGMLECALWIAAFVGFGLGCAAIEARAGARSAYDGYDGYDRAVSEETHAQEPAPPEVWLIDGYNVLHAGVLRGRDRSGWWKAAVQARLVALAGSFDDPAAEVWVVFDRKESHGAEASALPEPPADSRVRLVYAASADEWLVKRVRQAENATRFAVVTADRQVQGRARHAGAQVVSPLRFLARCDAALRAEPAPGSDAG